MQSHLPPINKSCEDANQDEERHWCSQLSAVIANWHDVLIADARMQMVGDNHSWGGTSQLTHVSSGVILSAYFAARKL